MYPKESKTHSLTYGAMIIAIFGMLLLVNRQTGSMFEEVFLYVFPIPMVAYSAIYGWKKGVPVFIGMCLISFLCGSIVSVFYAISQAFIGLAFGTSLNHHRDMTRTLLMVMVLSTLANILSTIVLASLFGFNIAAEVEEMRQMILTTMGKAYESQGVQGAQAMQALETVFSIDYLKRMYVVSMILLGAMQGYVVYMLSLLILRRLRFPLEKPKPLLFYFPPRWLGYVGFALSVVYFMTTSVPLKAEHLQDIFQTLGMAGYLFLVIFGVIATFHAILAWLTRNRLIAVVLSLLAAMFLAFPMQIVGFLYLSGSLHERILNKFGYRRVTQNGLNP